MAALSVINTGDVAVDSSGFNQPRLIPAPRIRAEPAGAAAPDLQVLFKCHSTCLSHPGNNGLDFFRFPAKYDSSGSVLHVNAQKHSSPTRMPSVWISAAGRGGSLIKVLSLSSRACGEFWNGRRACENCTIGWKFPAEGLHRPTEVVPAPAISVVRCKHTVLEFCLQVILLSQERHPSSNKMLKILLALPEPWCVVRGHGSKDDNIQQHHFLNYLLKTHFGYQKCFHVEGLHPPPPP